MLGERIDQRALFEADHLYLDHVGRFSFHGFLASYALESLPPATVDSGA